MTEPTTILLIEDNPADALYAKEMLSDPMYTFIEAKSLVEALECSQAEHVDVVLLDLSLPDSSGLDTVVKLVSKKTELPIVVLSGAEDIGSAIDALHAGAHDYIVKSRLNAEALIHSISYAIETKKRQQTEERLLERTRLTALTATVGQSLLEATTMQEMLRGCAKAMIAHFHAALVRIWTLEESKQMLVLQASCGLDTDKDGADRIPVGQSTVGLIASERKPHLTNAVQQNTGVSDQEWAKRQGMAAFAGHPLLVGNRLVGVMEVFARDTLSDTTVGGLTAVADQLGLGIDRKIAEEELSRLAAIVACSGDAIISKTLDGIVLSWNHAAERIYGYSADEMIGKSISILMPTDADRLLDIIGEFKQREYVEPYESTRRRKDGVIIDVSLAVSPIRDASGTLTGVSTIIRDITKRKRAEQLLRAQNDVTTIVSESKSLSDAAPRILEVIAKAILFDFGALWSLDREDHLLRCIDVWHESEPSFSELDSLSKHIYFAVGAGLPGRVLLAGKPAWIPALATETSFPRRQAALKSDLHAAVGFPIMLGTQVLGVIEFLSQKSQEPDAYVYQMMASIGSQIGQFMDRKHAEQAAMQSAQGQQRIGQAIMENAPIGIVWLDKNLVISGANKAFCQQFGLHQNDLPGTFIFQLQTSIPSERLIDVVKNGVPYSINNFRVVLGGALGPRDAFCDLTVWPVKDDCDQIVGLVILTVEVTERVKLAKQREDFVATLTHDLKNPLIGQDRMLELMLEGELGSFQDQQTEMLSLLKIGTQELLELIGTLLEVYRYEEGEAQLRLVLLDGKKLISTCIAQVNTIAGAKGIKIGSTFPEAAQTVSADQIALKRVVMNLLDNAIKFTPAGGFIHISCQCTDNKFILTIEDSGSGITIDELRALFQRFSQTGIGRTHKAGTGLGLYLCRQIVEAHGGEITCASKEGVGTTFIVTLPAA
jgi:PAS domain S-box-containing protein